MELDGADDDLGNEDLPSEDCADEDPDFAETEAVVIEINDRTARGVRRQSLALWILSSSEDLTHFPNLISDECEVDTTLGDPISYTRQFLTKEFLELIVDQSNQYSVLNLV